MILSNPSLFSGRKIATGLLVLGALGVASVSWALMARADVGPEISTTIHNGSHSTITTAAINSAVHARAVVSTSTSSTTPTGTVDFKLYNNNSCSGTPTTQAGVALINGAAESATTSVGTSGVSYVVRYNGDSNNSPSEDTCVVLAATAADTTLTNTLSSTTVVAGTSVHSSASLTNATANATGTVAYKVYTNNSCTAGVQHAGTKTVGSGSVPASDSIQFNTPGSYYWQAVYSGDQFNDAATTSCTSGKLTVLATSTPNHNDDDDEDDDEDNGNHKGWLHGLPFGIAKKILNRENYQLPPGIAKHFGDHFLSVFKGDNDNDEDEDDNDDNDSKKQKGRGERGNRSERN